MKFNVTMHKFFFTLIVLFPFFPLNGQLIQRTADKLIIGNEIIQREICIKENQFHTQSIKTAQSERDFLWDKSYEFSFLLNGEL